MIPFINSQAHGERLDLPTEGVCPFTGERYALEVGKCVAGVAASDRTRSERSA